MERKLVLECLKKDEYDVLEMYILLTNDIVELDVRPSHSHLDTILKRFCSEFNKTYNYEQYEYLLLTLLKTRCPVSISISRELPLYSL